jgi:hypothetical protein
MCPRFSTWDLEWPLEWPLEHSLEEEPTRVPAAGPRELKGLVLGDLPARREHPVPGALRH